MASPVPVELRLAPPGKVEIQLDIDHIWSVGSWWIVCLVIFGGRGWDEMALHRRDTPYPGKYIINWKLTKYSRRKLSGWLLCDLWRLEFTFITRKFGIL